MKLMNCILTAMLAVALFDAPRAVGQQTSASTDSATTESQQANIDAYVEILRSDVRTQKIAILTQIMQLNDAQSAKFWPIYREYDVELQALNDQKLAGIKEYAKNYENMTDDKANQLANLALELENKRNDLKKKYYEKVRDQLGGIIAARFLQVENQLLMLVDLQISSSLPVIQQ